MHAFVATCGLNKSMKLDLDFIVVFWTDNDNNTAHSDVIKDLTVAKDVMTSAHVHRPSGRSQTGSGIEYLLRKLRKLAKKRWRNVG